MAYNKRNWPSGLVPLSKSNLEAMDQGIFENSENIETLNKETTAESLRKKIGVYPIRYIDSEPTESTVGKQGETVVFEDEDGSSKFYLCVSAGTNKNIWDLIAETNPKDYVPNSRKVAGVDLADDITKNQLSSALGLSSYVAKTRKVAEVDLADDITVDELQGALGTYPILVLEKLPLTSELTVRNKQVCLIPHEGSTTIFDFYICFGARGEEYGWGSLGSLNISQEKIASAIKVYFEENPIKDGVDGKSAYEVALENGFEGTQNQWLESLKGADGSSASIEVTETDDGYDLTVINTGDSASRELISIKHGKDSTNSITIPTYWQKHLECRTDSIRECMELAGRNKSAFLFYSDAHWDSGSKNTPILLNYLTANTAINKTIYGGDIVSTEPTTDTLSDRTIMKYLWDWRSQIRNLRHYSVVGNHDDGNTTNNIFSYDYVYSYLFAPEENNNIVRGADTYYYFDDNREQTRYLCLDTAYESAYTLSDAQTAFIKEALISTPENWHIVVVAHIWYMPDYDQYSVRPIPLKGLSDTATQLVAILDNYNARVDEFADCKSKIEFCIGGHVHRDYVDITDGGIPIILCETASLNIRGEFTYTLGTTTETAVSGIVADYDNDKLSVIRVGRGNSFEVKLSTGETTEIEYPDEGATESTYTNVLEEVGYTKGIYLSGGNEGTDENAYTTGYIPCQSGSTVYLKNVTMPDEQSHGNRVGVYKADKTLISCFCVTSDQTAQNPIFDENGNLTRFYIHYGDELAYIRLSAWQIDDTSIITVNEPIE